MTNIDKFIQQDIMALGYGLISKKIMTDNSISIEAKGIYAYLASFAGNDHIAFPSKKKILNDLNISENRYYKHREQLIKAGYLTVNTFNEEESNYKKTTFHLNQTINVKMAKQDLKQKSKSLLAQKESKKASTMENFFTQKKNLQNRGGGHLQNEGHNINNNTINNNNATKATTLDSQTAYCTDYTHILDSKSLTVISNYALNQQNQFDLRLAKEIESYIFKAKHCAEKELLAEGMLAKEDLMPINANATKFTYKLNFEAIEFHNSLARLLQNIRLDIHYYHKIKAPIGYFFNALKSILKDEILLDKLNNSTPKFEIPILDETCILS